MTKRTTKKPIDLTPAIVVKGGALDSSPKDDLSALDHLAIVPREPKPERRRRAHPGIVVGMDLSKVKKAQTDFTEAFAMPSGFKPPKTTSVHNVYYVLRHGSQFVRTYKIQHGSRTTTYTPKLKLASEFGSRENATVVGGMLSKSPHPVCEVVDYGGDIGPVVYGRAEGPIETGKIKVT